MTDLEREASGIVREIVEVCAVAEGYTDLLHWSVYQRPFKDRIVELAKVYAGERDGPLYAYADCGHLVPVLSFYRFDPVALTAVDNCAQRHACLGCDGRPVCEAGCVKDCTCPPSS